MKSPNKEYRQLIYDLKREEIIQRGTVGSDSVSQSLRLDSAKKIEIIKEKISRMRDSSFRKTQKWRFSRSRKKLKVA